MALRNPDMTLNAKGLMKSFGKRVVVNGVDLEVSSGEVVGLLGPNGAGKTTSFYMVVGLARPDSGRIFLNGDDITELPMYLRARKGVSYLPQEPSVFRKLTVTENLMAVLKPWIWKRPGVGTGSGSFWPSSELPGSQGARDMPCREESGGGWRSPGRLPPIPRSSCWMSRLPE